MKTERELFLDWHFLDWKLHNAVTDSLDFAKFLYDRVYSHNHTSSVREVEFKAWCASAQREGYKLVPVENIESIYKACNIALDINNIDIYKGLAMAIIDDCQAMIGVVDSPLSFALNHAHNKLKENADRLIKHQDSQMGAAE